MGNVKFYTMGILWGKTFSCEFKCLWSTFAVVSCCLHAVFARFKTKMYSKFFRFLATTAKKG